MLDHLLSNIGFLNMIVVMVTARLNSCGVLYTTCQCERHTEMDTRHFKFHTYGQGLNESIYPYLVVGHERLKDAKSTPRTPMARRIMRTHAKPQSQLKCCRT